MKKIYYSFLAFPLSCVGIPLYIHLASFYINNYDVSLGLIGLVIFICRIFDCLFDPLAGYVSDYLINKQVRRVNIIFFFTIPLLISFYFLFGSKNYAEKQILYLLAANLLLLFFSLSFVLVNYEAIVSDLRDKRNEYIANREFMQILGILTISILPTAVSNQFNISYDQALQYMWVFISPLFGFGVFLLRKDFNEIKSSSPNTFKVSLSLGKSRKLFLIYFLNSIAVSIPAVSIRFYVDNHLKVPHLNGHFLGLYFLSAATSLFIWVRVINKFKPITSWKVAILLSVVTFIFAIFVRENNYYLFYFICVLSGLIVGCDLIAPQLILLDGIKEEVNKTSYFAIFSLITKISLAISTFLILGIISKHGMVDYAKIPYVYALLPCVFKILTWFVLRKL